MHLRSASQKGVGTRVTFVVSFALLRPFLFPLLKSGRWVGGRLIIPTGYPHLGLASVGQQLEEVVAPGFVDWHL